MKHFGPSPAMTDQARAIIRDVAREHRIGVKLIMGQVRWREVVIARVEIARRLTLCGYSSPRIAAILGKHHATILYYIGRGKRTVKLRPTDPQMSVCWNRERKDDMKLTPAQREELVRRAQEGGYASSKVYAKEIGVSPNYGLVLLERMKQPRRHSKKWQRAVAAGPVLA